MPRCYAFSPLWLVAALTATLDVAPARAAEGRVRITVVTILASENGTQVDEKIECIAREVQKVNAKLTNFRRGITHSKSIEVGAREEFQLIDNEKVVVTAESGRDADGRVALRVQPTSLGEIRYVTTCGKCFPIITRYTTKDKERLIIAVMVQACNKK
jgi:hypothetical protein